MPICRCEEQGCGMRTFVDDKGKQRKGQELVQREFNEHQTLDRVAMHRKQNVETEAGSSRRENRDVEQHNRDPMRNTPLEERDVKVFVRLARDTINELKHGFDSRSKIPLQCQGLVFVQHPPKPDTPISPASVDHDGTAPTEDFVSNPTGRYQLKYNSPANAVFLAYEKWLNTSLITLGGLELPPETSMVKRTFEAKLRDEIKRIMVLKTEEWRRQSEADPSEAVNQAGDKEVMVDTMQYMLFSAHSFSSDVVYLAYLLAASIHLFSHVSEDHCNFVLRCLKLIVDNCQSDPSGRKPLSASIPSDTRTVVDHLHLLPRVRHYASCPKCSFLYEIPASEGDTPVPERCTFRALRNGSQCLETLRKDSRGSGTSIKFQKEFHCRDVMQWIAELLCRSGNESKLDRNPYSQDELRRDIWDGDELRTFMGPDGQRPFVPDTDTDRGSEGRYVFGFCWDGFNPFGNKQAGKKVTCGAIYLVCYNFPIEDRYLPENILLFGIIPGPEHPSKEKLNQFLRPLVDDMEILWSPGIFLNATPMHPNGRSVKAALIPIVADLPAARQAAGHSSHSSAHMCSFCWLERKNINNLDKLSWPRKSAAEHRELASSWEDAESVNARKKFYTIHGTRHSEFLRLSYWNPVEHVSIDSMHLFLLGNLHRHCRRLWGFNQLIEDDEDSLASVTEIQSTSPPSRKEMAEGLRAFYTESAKNLQKHGKKVLYHLCLKFHCLPEERLQNRIASLRGSLVHFRIQQRWFSDANTPNPIAISKAQEADASDSEESEGDEPEPPTNDHARDYEEHSASESSFPLSGASQRDVDAGIEVLLTCAVSTCNKRLKKDILLRICDLHFEGSEDELKSLNKIDLIDRLKVLLLAKGMTAKGKKKARRKAKAKAKEGGEEKEKGSRKTGIIGRNILKAVQDDAKRMDLPSWVTPAPSSLGTGGLGKLTADQWKAVCSINLVVTLVRIWGNADEKGRQYLMLSNFMDLVTAVKLGCKRVLELDTVRLYEEHMLRYLQGLTTIYAPYQLLPYQHLAMHFGENLQRFGPTHATRCFVYERENLRLQKTVTNQKFGELERTMFEKYCKGQRLRAFLKQDETHETSVGRAMRDAFMACFDKRRSGTLATDILALCTPKDDYDTEDEDKLSQEELRLLGSWYAENTGDASRMSKRAIRLDSFTRYGARFTVRQKHRQDSNVIVGSNVPNDWDAARLIDILVHRAEDGTSHRTFLLIERYKRLTQSDAQHDYYRKFPIAGGRIYYEEPRQTEIVPVESLLCHFVLTPQVSTKIARRHFHSLPLDK